MKTIVKKDYIELKDLEVYKLSRQLSSIAWRIYEGLSWKDQKIMGDQFIESTDSTGGNIAEGYGRFHYLDKIKFYYNSRGSYFEARKHWLSLLHERKKITEQIFQEYDAVGKQFLIKHNNFISATFRSKENDN